MSVDAKLIDTKSIAGFVAKAKDQGVLDTLMHIIPNTVIGAFAEGEIPQVLFFAVLFAVGLQGLGERDRVLVGVIDQASHTLFGVVRIIMLFAPLGAFGAMAFTSGKYGITTLMSLGMLMASFYANCLNLLLFLRWLPFCPETCTVVGRHAADRVECERQTALPVLSVGHLRDRRDIADARAVLLVAL